MSTITTCTIILTHLLVRQSNISINFISRAFSVCPRLLGTLCFFLFLSCSGWHTLSSYASAEACLTGWPNAQPQGRDYCSVARHHQANLMVCVVCSCCATCPYREVCRAKGGIANGETLCHDIYPALPITTVLSGD